VDDALTPDRFGLTGKTAVVTGATGGLGAACAEALLEHGASVIITSRNAARAEAAADALRPHGPVDVVIGDLGAGPAAIEQLVVAVAEKCRSLDILVNNAGAAWAAPLDQYPDRAWSKLFGIDATVPFQLVQGLLPALEAGATAENPARVINIGSIDGHQVGPFENYAYSAAKSALHHLTRVLAYHLGPRHITVNCLAPGPIVTRMTESMLQPHELALTAANPLGRLGTPRDVAGPVVFLASPAAAYITGSVIPIDGGYSVRPWAL
jgi:NAD(P)-dependent dehydrogenase (short-subunit alcohol dehydrogenase family)